MTDERSKNGKSRAAEAEAESAFRVDDRRHWVDPSEGDERENDTAQPPRAPSIVEEYRERAEGAEARLQEYIEAFKRFREEQEDVRVRLARDVERRAEVRFGQLVTGLLETADDLELALGHVRSVPEAESLARGVELAHRRFLDALAQSGVERFGETGAPFDPNEAEALRVDPVPSAEQDGTVTEVLQPGYRMSGRVLRAARVAVGRHGTV